MKFLAVFLVMPMMCVSSLFAELLADPTAAPPTVATFTPTSEVMPTSTPVFELTMKAYYVTVTAEIAAYTPTPSHTPIVIPTNTSTPEPPTPSN